LKGDLGVPIAELGEGVGVRLMRTQQGVNCKELELKERRVIFAIFPNLQRCKPNFENLKFAFFENSYYRRYLFIPNVKEK
jgi:hypothetical protein